MNLDEPIQGTVEIVATAGVTQQHEAAAMDVQVATAQALGRRISDFQADLKLWSCHSQEIADECTYILKKGKTTIIGPSVRFAELLQQAYRHIVVDTFIEDEQPKFIVVGASARDLFRNTAVRARVKRSVVTKNGQRYGPDMIQTTTQAAGSIALRNAIIRLIPKALWQDIWLQTRDVAQGVDGDGERVVPFTESVDRAVKYLGTFEVSEQELLAHLGYGSRADIDANDLSILRNKARQIRSGEIDAHAAFPEHSDDTTSVGGKAAAEEVAERVKKAAAKAAKKATKKGKKDKKPPKKKAPAEKKADPESEPVAAKEAPEEEPGDDVDGIPSLDL
jgi:hypothetical protein